MSDAVENEGTEVEVVEAGKTFSQEEVTRIATKAEAKAQARLISELGLDSADALKSILADHQARVDAETTASQKLTTIQEQLTAQAAELEAYKATASQQLEAALEGLTEDQRKLLPAGSVAQQLAWVTQAAQVFGSPAAAPPANVNNGAPAPANNAPGVTLDEFKAMSLADRAEFYTANPARAAELSRQMRTTGR